jgi:hypothetical protein
MDTDRKEAAKAMTSAVVALLDASALARPDELENGGQSQ